VALRRGAADVASTAALSAALLLMVQLAGNYWNATYLAWTLPLLLIGLFTVDNEAAQ
jgi:hypothetical protein